MYRARSLALLCAARQSALKRFASAPAGVGLSAAVLLAQV